MKILALACRELFTARDGTAIKFLALCSFILLSGCESEAHPIKDYQQAREIFWQSLYPLQAKTLYCQQQFDSDYRKGINIEHVFPMSWAKNAIKCGTRKQCRVRSDEFNLIEADLHNLFPSRSDVNYERSSFSFGEVEGERRTFGKDCDFEVSARTRRAEPAPEVRGEVARAMFYMANRYRQQGLKLFKKQGEVLAHWHEIDPPSEHEHSRNDKIERLQGNRNPFIDEPGLLSDLVDQGRFY